VEKKKTRYSFCYVPIDGLACPKKKTGKALHSLVLTTA
jgi:hypothetical protein